VGGIFNKSIFNEIFTNSLLFWSFLFATFSPMIFDLIYRKTK
ncbi:MAG: sodium:solute symporter, partial [Proteobacteria bacterium]|nr:sodium:solute symporter [Candidatus Fonsibacter lacus]